jgi:two-component system chemotaxis response regulator CheY
LGPDAGAASEVLKKGLVMPRFLIVDDDPVAAEMLKEALARYGECDAALDGQQAIDLFKQAMQNNKPYDMACLDILMPNVGGHDVLREIRRLEGENGIAGSDGVKVIMTTALRDSKHCLQAFREGCESYITKPVNATELLQQMYALGVLERGAFDETGANARASR